MSVVIPACNRQDLVCRAVRTALSQTHTPLEVIVIDDCSTDATLSALADIADPRLTVHSLTERSGAPVARNQGIARARGDWVAFLDDDDYWLPLKIDHQLAASRASAGAGVVYCQRYQQFGDRVTYRPTHAPTGNIVDSILEGEVSFQTSCLMVHRALLADVRFDTRLAAYQDFDFCLELAARTQFALADEPLVVATGHAGARITGDLRSREAAWALIEDKWGALAESRGCRAGFRALGRRVRWHLDVESVLRQPYWHTIPQRVTLLAQAARLESHPDGLARLCARLAVGVRAAALTASLLRRLGVDV